MTNKEDEGDEICDSRLAALLAVHLVGQVLEEAYITANAARESGQPWRYLMMKNFRNNGKNSKIDHDDVSYATSKGDNVTFIASTPDEAEEMSDDKVLSNQVVTSTPQKKLGVMENDVKENNLMGRGDEEYGKTSNDLTNSTSNYINHLFDMSEVEKVTFSDDIVPTFCDDNIPTDPKAIAPLQDIAEMVKSYVNAALSMALLGENQEKDSQITINSSRSTDRSCYSFLSDAFTVDPGKDDAFFIDHGESNVRETSGEPMIKEVTLEKDVKIKENKIIDDTNRTEINTALYENVYLTLNRDYEQCSEDGDPVLQDPKGLSLQEVELMTAHTSAENLTLVQEEQPQQHCEELAAMSAISASATGSRKSSLVHRCRTQGARLLACLRGWWRRKTPGKRKDSRAPGTIRGICPLSPDARRRAASLLDQRLLRSPTASHSVVWKFNTVNEALVNSSRWKEYTFEVKPDECGELNIHQ